MFALPVCSVGPFAFRGLLCFCSSQVAIIAVNDGKSVKKKDVKKCEFVACQQRALLTLLAIKLRVSIWVREHLSVLRERCLKSRMSFLFCCLFACFSSFFEVFSLLVFKSFWKKTFLLRTRLGYPLPWKLQTGRKQAGVIWEVLLVFLKNVCHAATIIPRILRGFHSPAFRAPFFIWQPALLETPEGKKKIKKNK